MPRLVDPSGIRSRPTSVVLGELAIAAGLVGESVTITCDFAANTICQIWRYYTQALGASNVIHAREKKDIKDFGSRLTDVRAVFVYSPRMHQDVAWPIQMAGSGLMSPRPAVFCGFQHQEPDADPGLTLPLTNDESEVAAVHTWASDEVDRLTAEVEAPSSIDYDVRLAAALHPSAFKPVRIGYRELRIAGALVEGAALLRSVAGQTSGDLTTTLDCVGRDLSQIDAKFPTPRATARTFNAVKPAPHQRFLTRHSLKIDDFLRQAALSGGTLRFTGERTIGPDTRAAPNASVLKYVWVHDRDSWFPSRETYR
jgi:hypothetical protein